MAGKARVYTRDHSYCILSGGPELRELEQHEQRIGERAFQWLKLQNEARIYSFLFYYGRLLKNLPSRHEFFAFSDSISWSEWSYTLPQNQLYKYEISFLSEQDELTDIRAFMHHIEAQTPGTGDRATI